MRLGISRLYRDSEASVDLGVELASATVERGDEPSAGAPGERAPHQPPFGRGNAQRVATVERGDEPSAGAPGERAPHQRLLGGGTLSE